MSEVLERRYRRSLRMLLPGGYREARGEEMLDTLMEGAGPDQRWPRVSELFSIGLHAARVRVGASADADGQKADWRDAFRIAALCGAFFFAVPGGVVAFSWVTGWDRGMAFDAMSFSGGDDRANQAYFVTGTILPVVWLAVFVALIFAFRRTALGIALLGVVAGQWCVDQGVAGALDESVVVLTFLAMALSTARSLPLTAGRRWWLGTLVGVDGLVLVFRWIPYSPAVSRVFYQLVDRSAFLLLAGIAVAVVIGAVFTRAPLWPVVVAVIGAPFLTEAWPDGDGSVNGGVHILEGYHLEPMFIVAAMFAVIRVAIQALLRHRSIQRTPEA
jgi:hypothetical protein